MTRLSKNESHVVWTDDLRRARALVESAASSEPSLELYGDTLLEYIQECGSNDEGAFSALTHLVRTGTLRERIVAGGFVFVLLDEPSVEATGSYAQEAEAALWEGIISINPIDRHAAYIWLSLSHCPRALVGPLLAHLNHPEKDSQRLAAAVLCRAPNGAVEKYLSKHDEARRSAGSSQGIGLASIVRLIADGMTSSDDLTVRSVCARAYMEYFCESDDALSRVLRAIEKLPGSYQYHVIAGLSAIDGRQAQAEESLVRIVDQSKAPSVVVGLAVQALGAVSRGSDRHIARLLDLLESPDAWIAMSALLGIQKTGSQLSAIEDTYVRLAGRDDESVRILGLKGIATLKTLRESTVSSLLAYVVRARTKQEADLLGESLARIPAVHIPSLLGLVRDSGLVVHVIVSLAVAGMDDEEYLSVWRAYSLSVDGGLREVLAASVLRRGVRLTSIVPSLLSIYRSTTSSECRLLIVYAVWYSQSESDAAIEMLVDAVLHAEHEASMWAVNALRRIWPAAGRRVREEVMRDGQSGNVKRLRSLSEGMKSVEVDGASDVHLDNKPKVDPGMAAQLERFGDDKMLYLFMLICQVLRDSSGQAMSMEQVVEELGRRAQAKKTRVPVAMGLRTLGEAKKLVCSYFADVELIEGGRGRAGKITASGIVLLSQLELYFDR